MDVQTQYFPLQGEIRADVCVVGAGFTGLSTALNLAEGGYKVALLEGARIGWGASGRNGGQMLTDVASGMGEIESQLGATAARQVWDMTVEAVDIIGQRCAKHRIDCNLTYGYFHAALKARQMRDLANWQEAAAGHYGYDRLDRIEQNRVHEMVASTKYIGGMYDPGSGHLHPLRYAQGLARAATDAGVQIYEHSRVQRLEQGKLIRARTDMGTVVADHGVLGCNVYLGNLNRHLARKIMPVGTYIIATEPLGRERALALIPKNIAVCDVKFVLDYYRLSSDWRLLYGGRVSYSGMTPPALQESMRRDMVKIFPQLADVNVDYGWGGHVDVTINRAPHFGRIDNNLYFAQGYSGHGVALTGLAGKMIAESIAGQSERFDLFAKLKHRDFPGGRLLRTPALMLAMTYYHMRDFL